MHGINYQISSLSSKVVNVIEKMAMSLSMCLYCGTILFFSLLAWVVISIRSLIFLNQFQFSFLNFILSIENHLQMFFHYTHQLFHPPTISPITGLCLHLPKVYLITTILLQSPTFSLVTKNENISDQIYRYFEYFDFTNILNIKKILINGYFDIKY